MRLTPVLAGTAALLFTAAVPALASDNANVTPLYSNSDSCGGAPASSQTAANQQGFANFHLDGQTVTLNYHVKGGDPDATYYVYGYDSFCHFDAFLGTIVTNGNGVGNADFSYTIPAGATTVWTFSFHAPFGFAQDVETPAVTP